MKRIAAALLLVPATMMVVSCSRPPEQQFLTQFFSAARGRDNTTVGRMSAVEIDPRTQGAVDDFEITSISDEKRAPLSFKPLFEAEAKAREEEKAFLATKIEYQNANIKSIEQVLKLEAQPDAKLPPALQKVKAEWDKWREGIAAHARATASATAAIKSSTGLAEASLTQPGQPATRRADVRRRDDQQGRGGERRRALAGWADVAEDADHHHRARGRRRPRGPADHHED